MHVNLHACMRVPWCSKAWSHTCTASSFRSRAMYKDSRCSLGAAIGAYDYVFSENGLVAYKAGELLAVKSMLDFMGEDKLQKLLNFILHYIAGQGFANMSGFAFRVVELIV